MEAAKAMLHDQDLPMHLWEEATRKYLYVQDRTPNQVHEKKNTGRIFLMRETKSQTSQNIWLPSVHAYPKGEEDQA